MAGRTSRDEMVDLLAARGITDGRILEAFSSVPREDFLPADLARFAYDDAPLPIGGGQTISQPYIVALTIDALGLKGGERVLEIGTGSGYAAAILSRVAGQVFTVERLESLAEVARERLSRLGYRNVHVLCGDGTLGWAEHAPFDAIAVAAAGPEVPQALLTQLAPGGRLVIPVGATENSQVLQKYTRESETEFRAEPLSDVRFVPLIGEQGWPETSPVIRPPQAKAREAKNGTIAKLVREAAEPMEDLETSSLENLIDRIGDARLVLLGEATHGTSEFYRMRARLSKELIKRGFDFVAVEADWPDAMRINRYVCDEPRSKVDFTPFSRFPTWMWRNEEVGEFVEWLRARNLQEHDHSHRAGFYGLDLYSMFTSIAHVLEYLDAVDPGAARVARTRYGTLTPWQKDPAAYGQAVLVGDSSSSEQAVVAMLQELLERRLDYAQKDGERFFDAAQNARVVADAERYYRAMYYGSAASWNLRDTHMFDTLRALLAFHGPESRGIIWEHNSHLGDARATEMSVRGELNVGQLCRTTFDKRVHAIGFGTDHGTVAAANDWDEPMQRFRVRPALPGSYERVCHESGVPAFILHLREPRRPEVREELMSPLLERAIGVVYRPDTERASHYFFASLPVQFDEFIWFDETRAVVPLPAAERGKRLVLPEAHPFAL